MTRTGLAILGFFGALAVAQRLLEPAYPFFLFVFGVVVGIACRHAVVRPLRVRHPLLSLFACAWIAAALSITVAREPDLRDVIRDGGAVLAFLIGRYAVPAMAGADREERLLGALSDLGVAVALATLLAATAALFAGVDAYEWRGSYIPYAHNWLPMLLVATVGLADQNPARGVGIRVSLLVVATLASLSRTDVLMMMLFALWLLFMRGRHWLSQPSARSRLVIASMGIVLLTPPFLALEVVGERLQAGVGDEDLSVGWRLLENLAMFSTMDQAGPFHWLFGLGLGARVDLPAGIADFSDNTSIPHLHNSYLTIILKFGVGGLALMLTAVALLLWRVRQQGTPARRALRMTGSWMLIFVAGKAITLHGLSEWSHLVFAGLGCALLAASCRRPTPLRLSA
jgi:O-antigen ligase